MLYLCQVLFFRIFHRRSLGVFYRTNPSYRVIIIYPNHKVQSKKDSNYGFLFSVNRALNYPKYEYRLITNLVYARKYNVYFALGKDFSLKVRTRSDIFQ